MVFNLSRDDRLKSYPTKSRRCRARREVGGEASDSTTAVAPEDQRGKVGEAVAGLDTGSPCLLGVVTARTEIVRSVAAALPVFEHHFLQDQAGPEVLEAGIKTAPQAVDGALPAVVVDERGRLIVEIEQVQVNGSKACGGRMGVAEVSADLGVAKIRLVASFALPASLGKRTHVS